MKRVLSTSLLLTSLVAINAHASPRDNGFYAGINYSVIDFASTYFETSANINGTGSHLNKAEHTYRNSFTAPKEFKVGYKHLNNNRLELVRRNTNLLIGDNEEKIASRVLGINYEFGISSLASKNKKALPFISLGVANGKATSKSNALKIKTADVVELDITVGLHYQLSKHIDTTVALSNRATILIEDAKNNSNNVFTDGDIDSTAVNVGISYHF